MDTANGQDLMTPDQAADTFGVSVRTLRRMVNRGQLQKVMISGKVFYRPRDPVTFGRMIDRVQATVDQGDIVVRDSVQLTRERLRDLQHDYSVLQDEANRLRVEIKKAAFSWRLMFTAAAITAIILGVAAIWFHSWYQSRGDQLSTMDASLSRQDQIIKSAENRANTAEKLLQEERTRNAQIIMDMLRSMGRESPTGADDRRDPVGESI